MASPRKTASHEPRLMRDLRKLLLANRTAALGTLGDDARDVDPLELGRLLRTDPAPDSGAA